MKKIFQLFVIRNIKRYFSFLFSNGYRARDIWCSIPSLRAWNVILESSDCLIIIAMDRDELFLSFAPLDSDSTDRICLEAMIYFLSHEKVFVVAVDKNSVQNKTSQFEKMSSLLKDYHDHIVPYFGRDFSKYREELFGVQKRYNDRLLSWYAAH